MKRKMKNWIKLNFPSLTQYMWRRRMHKVSIRPKKFRDGTIFYGIQNEQYEPQVMRVLRDEAKNYRYFVNLGANTGFFIITLSNFFDKLLAVEALPENANALARNIYVNKLSDKCTLFNAAVGAKFEILRFFGAGTSGSLVPGWNAQSQQSAFVQSLPGDFIHQNCLGMDESALYLIDCEGAEYSVLCGLRNVIMNTNSAFFVEVPCREFMPDHVFNPNFLKTFEMMFSAGYGASYLNSDDVLELLPRETVASMIEYNRFEGIMVLFKRM